MMSGPLIESFATDEFERLAALRALDLLDSPAAESFDRITRLAAAAIGTPIALVSLVDESRQWFKSRVGLEVTQTARDISFCTHVVDDRRPLVVVNAADDARFADNPLVTGLAHIRSYAGIPLFTRDGHAVGTLCVIDQQARQFSERDMACLRDCAFAIQELIQAQDAAAEKARKLSAAAEREAVFRDTFEKSPLGILHMALSGHILRANAVACGLLGFGADELCHLSFADFTHPDDMADSSQLLQRMTKGGEASGRLEKRYRCKDGSVVWVRIAVSLVRNDAAEPHYLIAVIDDVSERKQAETAAAYALDSLERDAACQNEKLQDTHTALQTHVKRLIDSERDNHAMEHRLRSLTDSVPAFIGYWNRDLRCEFANEAYRKAFGLSPDKIVGMSMTELLGERGFAEAGPYARRALLGAPQTFERVIALPDGLLTYTEIRFLPDLDSGAEIPGFFVLATDVTHTRNLQIALEAANAALANNRSVDYLTGIANQRSFTEAGETALARYYESSAQAFGVMLIDIDGFSRVNATHGHEVGDQVLRGVSKILKSQLRSHRDVAARLSADRFAVLSIGDLNQECLAQMAEGVRALVAQEVILCKTGDAQVTASVGLALVGRDDKDWSAIEMRADAALYKAKEAGRNRAVLAKAS